MFLFIYTCGLYFCKSFCLESRYDIDRDQAKGRLGRNGTQGEVGVSLKKKKKIFFFFFFRETHFHSVITQMQAVVTLSDNLLPLHPVFPSIKWQ